MERYYEDLQVGDECESPGRTITETDIVNFAAISGDWSPVHTDEEYCTMVNQRGEVIQEGEHGLMVLRKGSA